MGFDVKGLWEFAEGNNEHYFRIKETREGLDVLSIDEILRRIRYAEESIKGANPPYKYTLEEITLLKKEIKSKFK